MWAGGGGGWVGGGLLLNEGILKWTHRVNKGQKEVKKILPINL